MLKIEKFASVKNYNSFAIEFKTKYLAHISEINDLIELLKKFPKEKKFFLGKGTNVLFNYSENKIFDGIIIVNNLEKQKIVSEDKKTITIEVESGFDWDKFVELSVKNGWYGLENLSNIPGSVGGAVYQNIGAYGVEAEKFIEKVEYLDLENLTFKTLKKSECQFGYRKSIFQNLNAFIVKATFKLSKEPIYFLDYAGIKEELKKFDKITPQNVRKAIINIRNNKLPNYKKYPNAGSFFKNPIITNSQLQDIEEKIKTKVPNYKISEAKVKIPAAFLIDKANLKGYSIGGAKIWEKSPLVIVNYKNATAKDIINLKNFVQQKIKEKYNIDLEPEVKIID